MVAYSEAMDAEFEKRRQGELERLKRMPVDEVMEIERDWRIEQISQEVFLFTYYMWSIYVGTRKPTLDGYPAARKFSDPAEQRAAAPEVINALRTKINDLEQRMTRQARGDAAGNS
jgi:hypothetical protein